MDPMQATRKGTNSRVSTRQTPSRPGIDTPYENESEVSETVSFRSSRRQATSQAVYVEVKVEKNINTTRGGRGMRPLDRFTYF